MFASRKQRPRMTAKNRETAAHKRYSGKAVDSSEYTGITFGHGIPEKGNPTRCLGCQAPIRENDNWQKWTSPRDPVLGSYSVIFHSQCAPMPKGKQ